MVSDYAVIMNTALPVATHVDGTVSLVDVLERVLDKGIVIDAWMRMSVSGIYVVMVEARILVASIETYLKHAELIREVSPAAAGSGAPRRAEGPKPRRGSSIG
jgi:gas vesicle structural protein